MKRIEEHLADIEGRLKTIIIVLIAILIWIIILTLSSCSKEPDCSCGRIDSIDSVYIEKKDYWQKRLHITHECTDKHIIMVLCETYDQSGLNYQVNETICNKWLRP